jgi:hypothetical protein
MVTTQLSVPEQPAPDQPLNLEPAAALAVSVTTVPSSYSALQVAPQLTPDGDELTDPEPEPLFAAVSV